jgi:outer membrane immunogenic protein
MLSLRVCIGVAVCLFSATGVLRAEEVNRSGKQDLGEGKIVPTAEMAETSGFDWTGLYFGVSAGGSFANVDHYYDRQNGNNDHGQVWMDTQGFNFSGNIGYNYQLANNFVFGAEAELGFLGLDDEKIVIKDDDILRIDTGLFGTARLRAGYAFDRFLPYATAGVGFVDVENAGGNPANAARFNVVDAYRMGLVLGAGADYAFSDSLFGRVEYLYMNTGEFEDRNLENEKMTWDNDIHLLRAALEYKLN